MKRLCKLFAFSGLLFLSVTVLAVSEEAVERNNVGARLLEQGKADAAIAEFQRALSLDPKYFPARLNLAYAYERADRTEEAMEAYREAIHLQPRNFFAHNNLGVLYDKKGLYDAAIREFETVLAIEPGNSMALKNLETAKKNEAAMKAREAQIQQAEREARAKPSDPQASYNLARVYAFYGEKDLAYEWLAKALQQGYKDIRYLRSDPAFHGIRDERDFQLLLRPYSP
ncbi:MAG TPA: tetratricopeptide repeat protein [Candidatus Binatia bacterium]